MTKQEDQDNTVGVVTGEDIGDSIMPLNFLTPRSNMYDFANATWNPIRGLCPHQCIYCYYQNNPRFKNRIGPLRLEEKELKTNLGEGRFIFVGSSTDMFAEVVPNYWICQVLAICDRFENTYLFQTKNPKRFWDLIFPRHSIFGTTLESNFNHQLSKAPVALIRQSWMRYLPRTMISIEPIMEFEQDILVPWISEIKPEFVSIGADSKGHNLPEPTPEKVNALIEEISKFTEVKIKANLARLMK